MFCPGLSVDGTGKMVISGGNSATKTTLYDFASGTWIPGPDMNLARGYQASATLSDGRVFTIGSCWSGKQFEKNGEIYDPKARTWKKLTEALVHPMLTNDAQGIYRADNHGWLFGWKSGSVFQVGPSTAMNWYTTSGNGGVTATGQRRSDRGIDGDSMNGNAVMYDTTEGEDRRARSSLLAAHPRIRTARPLPTPTSSPSGAPDRRLRCASPPTACGWSARSFHTSVVLPDGKAFITGGQSYAVPFSDDMPQLTPELYDPGSDSFYHQQPNLIIRVYHSVALLLPDGRVLSAGGGLCGDCNTNHFDGQVFTPQYLLTSDGQPATRPVIKSATLSGRRITITTDSAVALASLVRFGTATHSINTDQRRIPLTLAGVGMNTYTTSAPSNSGNLLPGYICCLS